MASLARALVQPDSEAQQMLKALAVRSLLRYWHNPYYRPPASHSDSQWLKVWGYGRLGGDAEALARAMPDETQQAKLTAGFLQDYGLGTTFRSSGVDSAALARVIYTFIEGNQTVEAIVRTVLSEFRNVQTNRPDKSKDQISASSKFLFFLRPELRLVIWDRYAVDAAKLHAALKNIHLNIDNSRDDAYDRYERYRGFVLDCFDPKMFDHEDTFATLVDNLASTVEPERRNTVHDFLFRRALDKLLFHEGLVAEHTKGLLRSSGISIKGLAQKDLDVGVCSATSWLLVELKKQFKA